MIQKKAVVAAAFVLVGCADTGDNRLGEVVELRSALGDPNQNDFFGRQTAHQQLAQRQTNCSNDPRVMFNLVSQDVCVGADLFFREPFGGNGRACGSCHTAQFDFTISPDSIALLAPNDPLFVAENNPALAQLERPDLMREHGLILENVDGAEAPTTKFVMRSVPHTFSLSTSITPAPVVNPDGTGVDGTTQPPTQRTGWSGDGAPSPGGLKQFQVGAVFQHYTKSLNRVAGTDFTVPTDNELNRIEQFLLSIGRTSDLDLTTITLADSGADTGRTTFLASRCNGCHRNAGANTAAGFNRNFDTGVEAARLAVLNTQGIPHDGGFGGGAPGAPFNHDADRDGINDSFGNGTFSTPPLIEAADTGPFFHTNAFDTIEAAITFYTTSAFANSPAGGGNAIALTATDIANIGKFLRVLNASFNAKLAIARLSADVQVNTQYNNGFLGLQSGLLAAAQAEVRDAITDLSAVNINPSQLAQLQAADQTITDAVNTMMPMQRRAKAQSALSAVQAADQGLGSGLTFSVGPGSIMF